nr:5'-3' exonuclease H3TH domain-containing protein [Lacrimispora amygdalina]
MKELLIIDGSSMLVTCYYANLPIEIKTAKTDEEREKYYYKILHSKNGEYTNAVYGMLGIIIRLLKNQKPNYLCVCFDQTRDTFRREMYKDYKGQRAAAPSPLIEQFHTIENILSELDFTVVYDNTYEADVWAGSIAKKYCDKVSVKLMTKDHDYLQLVEKNINVWMPLSEDKYKELKHNIYERDGVDIKAMNIPYRVFEYTEEYVKELEGVLPKQIPDLKAIVGDMSDNIPGVKGVSKAAIPLLNEYKTVEKLYEAIEGHSKAELNEIQKYWKESLGIKRSPMKALLNESEIELVGKKAAMLSKVLATIKTDIPIPFSLENMKAEYDQEKLKEICLRYDIKTIGKY